jgi:hypothetical protein
LAGLLNELYQLAGEPHSSSREERTPTPRNALFIEQQMRVPT